MVEKQKSWQEKLRQSKNLPRVVEISPRIVRIWGAKAGDTMVIPAPLEVDEIMRKVPRGKLITLDEIRKLLALKHGATIACPLSVGIFAWISAYASEEARIRGEKKITPYWRTLKTGGEINPKYPKGAEVVKGILEKEGHKIIKRGQKYFVSDFKKALVKL